MKVAIPCWRGRVSPVFDVARNVLIVDIEGGSERGRLEVTFDVDGTCARAARLRATGADVLVCGAISRSLEMALCAAGIEVISQTCGNVERVLTAFMAGRWTRDAFLMPGCCRRFRRFVRRGRHRKGPDEVVETWPDGRPEELERDGEPIP
jgi:predicted Fe-Mo cluster-binding NifX family protein